MPLASDFQWDGPLSDAAVGASDLEPASGNKSLEGFGSELNNSDSGSSDSGQESEDQEHRSFVEVTSVPCVLESSSNSTPHCWLFC